LIEDIGAAFVVTAQCKSLVFQTSGLQPATSGYSMRALAAFLINTQPPDTAYTNAPANATISVRQILTYLP